MSKAQAMNSKLDKEKMKIGHRRVDGAGQVTYKKVCWNLRDFVIIVHSEIFYLE
jgi:hypothetical protein